MGKILNLIVDTVVGIIGSIGMVLGVILNDFEIFLPGLMLTCFAVTYIYLDRILNKLEELAKDS